MIPFRECIEILSVGLLKYYKMWNNITEEDYKKETTIVYMLSNEIEQEMKTVFPQYNEITSITLFECDEITLQNNEEDGYKFGIQYLELLVKFISHMNFLPVQYCILSIDVDTLNGLIITHGMITQYFDAFYKS